jgi:hypothetical protein
VAVLVPLLHGSLLKTELRTKERLEAEAKRLDIGGRDFVCSSTVKKLKHEDTFEDSNYR